MSGRLPCVMEFTPRRRMVPPAPGEPPLASTVTPVLRPCRICCVLPTPPRSKSALLTVVTALPTSFLRSSPVAVTTTPASDTLLLASEKSTVTVAFAVSVTVRDCC